jgi:hypothetical protein
MRDPKTEQIYFAHREQASLKAARLSGESYGRVAHRKLAAAYAARSRHALAGGVNEHG